jgi:hypothetical protein
MDPVSLASAVVALLGPYVAQAAGAAASKTGEVIAEAALPKVRALYERLQARLAPGTYQRALLEGVEAEPDSQGRQEILRTELAKLLAEDAGFAAELEDLIGQAERAGGVHIAATDVGVVAGRDVNLRGQYVAGRDLRMRSPSEEDQVQE